MAGHFYVISPCTRRLQWLRPARRGLSTIAGSLSLFVHGAQRHARNSICVTYGSQTVHARLRGGGDNPLLRGGGGGAAATRFQTCESLNSKSGRHDFVVVETIDFYEDEEAELPPPMSLRDVQALNKAAPFGEEPEEEEAAEGEKEVEVRSCLMTRTSPCILGTNMRQQHDEAGEEVATEGGSKKAGEYLDRHMACCGRGTHVLSCPTVVVWSKCRRGQARGNMACGNHGQGGRSARVRMRSLASAFRRAARQRILCLKLTSQA